ncbi:MAG: HAMP domain-containing histidine kinase [Bacillus sp. (in: Bacteria)]|nr:HAMP domain-containing histidine kinase [Bacillus sp. (in: firmicutes)]MCM1427069.1 HAMP domain-containing histidine kinase [Eubacterium sp.]
MDIKMGNKKNKKSGKGIRNILQLLQHLCVAATVAAVLIITTGSTVIIDGVSDTTSYRFRASDEEKTYEESELFHMIYGRAAADIIRFGVIRSQLETDGKFDNDKVIDVTAYNYRDEGMPERYVTARYTLGDLLKWQKYGLEYSHVTMSREEAMEFLADKTMLTIVDPESKYYNTTDAGYMKSDIGAYTFVDDVSSNMLPYDGWDGDMSEEVSFDILVNRYKTVEGKNIEEYTADLANYIALCNNVTAAMESLSYNYEEYLAFQEYYDSQKTNIRYCIEKKVGKHTEYFTNMDDRITVESLEEGLENNQDMTQFFNKNYFDSKYADMGKYLYYSPSEMIYDTNSDIEESTIRNIVKKYDYAYPESIRIWIGVDDNYRAEDAFAQGKRGFQNYRPYFWQWMILAVSAAALYVVILVYLTITTGKYTDEEGNTRIRLSGFDKIPTEAALILGVCAALLIISGPTYIVTEWTYIFSYADIYSTGFKIGAGVLALIADMIFCLFYYSLIRRIKARVLWKNSYLKRIVRKCSKWMLDIYDNGSIVVRTWVPYAVFLLFNFLMIAMGLYTGIPAVLTILIALIIDMFVGAALYMDVKERQSIVKGIEKIAEGDFSYQVNQENMHGDNLVLAKSVNNIGKGIKNAVESSMKDERMKTDLITNVSHDIKTPLTSIINYVDLIKREEIDNERVRSYIKVLDEKSQRLKQLTDDLVEASKISSGTINLHFERINLVELLNQTIGEFSEKFEQKGLTTVMNVNTAGGAVIEADSRSIWRVMENLFNNIYKYTLENTRVYIIINSVAKDSVQKQEMIELSIKNISAKELNCNPDELTERFIRGDESRTTEGSGLGLSIAKNLTEAQHGAFEIQLDGDLFKVILTFQAME